jgi:5-methyltetrahydropteroyltriglutamate--homocysteine methyltransferase
MKRSTDRIITSHVGSLIRPPEVAALFRDRPAGKPFDADEQALIRRSVAAVVMQQAETGVDLVSDGEFSKSGFAGYISERLSGFEQRESTRPQTYTRGRDRSRFAAVYAEINATNAGLGIGQIPLVCAGPIRYAGHDVLRTDLENLRAACDAARVEEAFVPAVAPGTIALQRPNEYYGTDDEFLYAVADAMAVEYRMIVEAGFVLQIDDPRMVTSFDSMDPPPSGAEYRRFAMHQVEALNHALKGLPEESVRYHVCWGSWHGPHTTDIDLRDIVDVVLAINAGCYSVEAANPRHAHEYHVWETKKLPAGKSLMPGVIAHSTNVVEHPELVADRLLQYAERVGRENVIAGVDCGFAQGWDLARVHESIQWEKLRVLAEGARLASQRLWK